MNGTYLDNIRKLPSLNRLAHWINERQAILIKRKTQLPSASNRIWTKDPILRTYRFCNVHREDDRVTVWIRKNWCEPNKNNEFMWHAMIIARMLNWPTTLNQFGWPEPWHERKAAVARALLQMREEGQKIFTGAYIVSTNGVATDKVRYVLETFDRAWRCPDPPQKTDTLAVAHARLLNVHGLGNFMAAQVVADLKNTPYLAKAKDWWDWCAPGPGSLRGLARLENDLTKEERARGHLVDRTKFVPKLKKLRSDLTPLLNKQVGRLCLQDLQNCLCEFDKYERVLWDQGKPRALYKSHA